MISILVCLVLQAVLGGVGLNVSHKAAYNTLLGLRTSLQKKWKPFHWVLLKKKGRVQSKKMFVDDIGSLEVLLAHSLPEGIANLVVPIMVYVSMFLLTGD